MGREINAQDLENLNGFSYNSGSVTVGGSIVSGDQHGVTGGVHHGDVYVGRDQDEDNR